MSHLIPSSLQHVFASDQASTSTIVATVLGTLLAVKLSSYVFSEKNPRKMIRGPATTVLPNLSQAEREKLPHPPDVYPGGRDVESPYGATRVYEWGPEDGRKVLFVHGITTSCLPVGPMAQGLVERGCRVMIFDCWGRGYSDAPADLPHDERLYSTQILIAITSSPLSWTGPSGFSLIGYSLGGGISAAFTSYFPKLVESLVLVTPTGLIRPSRTVAQRRLFAIVSLLPKAPLEVFFRWKLQKPLFPNENAKLLQVKPVSVKCPHVTVMGAQQWQIKVHEGFFTSFMSTARYAPAAGQHESWKRIGLRKEKTLVIAATNDPIINPNDLKEDATEVLGAEKLEWKVIEGAHDIPVTDPEKIVGAICDFWGI